MMFSVCRSSVKIGGTFLFNFFWVHRHKKKAHNPQKCA